MRVGAISNGWMAMQGTEGTRARTLLHTWFYAFLDCAEEYRCIFDLHAELRMNGVSHARSPPPLVEGGVLANRPPSHPDVVFPEIDPENVSPTGLDARPPPPDVSELAPFIGTQPQVGSLNRR
jgi:hypothetical protein